MNRSRIIDWRRAFVRNLDAAGYFETFLVSAVATILGLRFYLYITGFPKVGGNGLHIAHMLWGGLLMLISLVILLAFLNRTARRTAALLSGIGFGLFIDELGKFLTSDNNYFFRPAISIIYVVFVALYFVFRLLQRDQGATGRTYLLNSIESLKEAVLHDFDHQDWVRAQWYVRNCVKDDRVAASISILLDQFRDEALKRNQQGSRLMSRAKGMYMGLVSRTWFNRGVIALFLGWSIVALIVAIAVSWAGLAQVAPKNHEINSYVHSFDRIADLIFGAAASAVAVFGGIVMVRSRLDGYRLFRISLLISIFLTQVFEFYLIQFAALIPLALDIVALFVIDTLMSLEKGRSRHQDVTAQPVQNVVSAAPSTQTAIDAGAPSGVKS